MSVNVLNIGTLPPASGVLRYTSNTRRLQRDNLEEYILRHLKTVPPRLLERIRIWLFPRPRLVARLIEMYLTAAQNGVKRTPYHRILSSAFEVSTGYRPMDAIDLEAQEEEIPEFILGLSFGCSVLEHKILDDPTFMRTESPLPPLEPRSPSYFTRNVCDDVALTEAYGAASLVALLGSPNIDIFKFCMTKAIIVNAEQPETEQTQKDIFERSIIWTLMNNLGKEDGGVLEDIFDFHDRVPLWAKQPYRLISFARGDNVPVCVTWKSGASPRSAFEPENMKTSSTG
ncbi:hypothetical protein F5146DRAFT_1145107 [Armillaria mellea]|nr:hypothetical protein F5146DRAFT_1145107 [Armillaria mellea]